MDRLQAMQTFVRVAELASFSAVAKQKGVARSVVTRQIAALETHLAAKLIARSTRRLSLTAAGQAYLEKCRGILELVEAAESDLAQEREELRGAIRISLPLSYGVQRLSPRLLEFARRHPGVDLEMDFSDRRVHLIEEGMDLAIRITPKLESGEVARRLATERMMVVAAPDYLRQHGTPTHPEQLADHDCLVYTGAVASEWQFHVDGRLRHFPVRTRIESNSGEVLVAAAAAALGITCKPEFIGADFVADGRVVEILSDFALPRLGVYAVLPGNRHVPHRVRTLIEWLAEPLLDAPAAQRPR